MVRHWAGCDGLGVESVGVGGFTNLGGRVGLLGSLDLLDLVKRAWKFVAA